MRESAIERALVKGCHRKGALCLKWVSPGQRGVPDRIIIDRTGPVWFVELKAPGKPLSPAQVRMRAELEGRNADYSVLDSIQAVRDFLTKKLW